MVVVNMTIKFNKKHYGYKYKNFSRMSSIYRKGRDGYYYYQAYVLNPSTGKKDKRIFYSLGTKDSIEAEAKKRDLDKKYENRLEADTHSSDNWLTRNKKFNDYKCYCNNNVFCI